MLEQSPLVAVSEHGLEEQSRTPRSLQGSASMILHETCLPGILPAMLRSPWKGPQWALGQAGAALGKTLGLFCRRLWGFYSATVLFGQWLSTGRYQASPQPHSGKSLPSLP